MYKSHTDEIVAYRIVGNQNREQAKKVIKDYLVENEVYEKGRDLDKACESFAKGSAFYSLFLSKGLLEWYEPVYAKISLSKEFMDEIGFRTTKDDGVYGEAVDIKTGGMTVINWNREGHSCTYFGEKLRPNISVSIRKDGGTRTAFSGYIFGEHELKYLLERTW